MKGPLEIQVAIQGGGAKIAALLAAAEALAELEQQGRISIKRLAGTSAGAIVACLLARRSPEIAAVRERLIDRGQQEIDRLFPPRKLPKLLWRAIHGKPIYETHALRRLLGEFFNKKGYIKLGDLGKPVFIVAADVLNGQKKTYMNPDDVILDALIDSAALPVVLRNWRDLSASAIVDGGICENLPSEELVADRTHGEVVAIGFARTEVPEHPNSLWKFALAILDTAINNSMDRARRRLHESAFISLSTDLRTFDFDRIVSSGLNADHYGRIKLEVERWFDKIFLVSQADKGEDTVLLSDPWPQFAHQPAAAEANRDLYRVYELQHQKTRMRIRRSTLVVTAYCLLDDRDPRRQHPDSIKHIVDLQPVDQPIYCHRIGLGSHTEAKFESGSSWSVRDAKGQDVKYIAIPVAEAVVPAGLEGGLPESQLRRYVLLFFDPILLPQQPELEPYRITVQSLVSEAMRPLRELGEDTLGNTSSRPEDPVERADLILNVPDSLPELEVSAAGGSCAGRRLTLPELSEYGDPPPGFRPCGWTASDLKPGAVFRAKFKVRGWAKG